MGALAVVERSGDRHRLAVEGRGSALGKRCRWKSASRRRGIRMIALPKVLVVGHKGQVGTEMCAQLQAAGYPFVVIDREECNLVEPGSVIAAIREVQPQVIVNAAAYTAVDKAEAEPELADAINAKAPTEMAGEA